MIIEGQLGFINFPAQVTLKADLLVILVVDANLVFFFVGIILEGQRAESALKRFGVHVNHDVTIWEWKRRSWSAMM